jgi:hypothetical protein
MRGTTCLGGRVSVLELSKGASDIGIRVSCVQDVAAELTSVWWLRELTAHVDDRLQPMRNAIVSFEGERRMEAATSRKSERVVMSAHASAAPTNSWAGWWPQGDPQRNTQRT